jgi:hypothetical protein
LLPLETIARGEICVDRETEYQLFFVGSESEWNDLWAKVQADDPLPADENASVIAAVAQTDFQTQALLIVLRCASAGHSVAINRAVELSDDHLTVYVELSNPAPGVAYPAVAYGNYEIARIPWPQAHSDSPSVEVVDYIVFDRPQPPATPTTVAGTVLPVETIQHGYVCEKWGNGAEYQLFFVRSETEWNDIWSQVQSKPSLRANESAIAAAVQETDFQTQALLLALRTCYLPNSGGYGIIIDDAVEISDDQLTVYVGGREPGSRDFFSESWFYEIARIPWPDENSDSPTVEVVKYILWGE